MNKPPTNKEKELMLPDEVIMDKIHLFLGQIIMLDRNLSELYGSKTKVLKQQVKRNLNRFPEDYMFELTREEFSNWRSQFVTSKSGRMGKPKPQVMPTHKPGWKTCGCGGDHPGIQDVTQNGWHRIIHSPYFKSSYSGPDSYNHPYVIWGSYNQFTLY